MIDAVRDLIDKTGKRLGMSAEDIETIKKIDHERLFDIRLDNGKSFKAYRIQHNNKRGPYKGGIRFHENVSLQEVQTLATLMSLKTAAIGIPMGGGKGGVAVNPRGLDESELEELSRKYVAHLHPHIGPNIDVPAPDVNTDSKIIDWMLDEFAKQTGDTSKASFTGKSIPNGGSLGREAATGRGGVLALAELLRLEKLSDQAISVAIQGFGNVGSFFGTVAESTMPNWRLVAVSDSEAALHNKDGLSAGRLQEFKSDRGRFKDYQADAVSIVTNSDLIALDVDVLVLAGLEDSVTSANVKSIQATYIVEMGNGPVTNEAHDYLVAHDKIVLPDIVANAGGVLVSYFEWLQNKNDERWSEEEVNTRLAKYMEETVKEMYKLAKQEKLSLKEAAFAMAIKRLSE